MERGMVLCLFCCLPCWVSGSSQVQCSADKGTVPVGGSVTMRCKLNSDCNTQDILQVTWRKQSGEFAGTIATSSRSHGQRFLGPYSNRKVRFAEEIQNCSAITIGSVTPGDQGCFQCIFNIYPLGASMGSVCLDITEASISDPKMEINLDSNNDHVISCSATGKPAPKITWNVTRTLEQNPQNYSINHPDQTVTVISNFTHRTLGRIHVTCVVHHPSLSSDIVLSKAIEDSQFFETSNSLSMTSLMIAAIVAAIPILIIIFYVIVHLCMKEHIIHKHLRICTEKYKEKPKVSPDVSDYLKCDEDV
ncbi:OX-2 membrane glycoprotein isoform X1 [Xenopus laevis]|uniref:OX-2 membrane glycoprotein isoform X1 n=1 Tax=Xenopus laevis TaxID=8355 RepID=A0A8J1M7S1_XENLA|nr:OX-2 membrane glycoprotein isoform X1 [Xenopus laevis]